MNRYELEDESPIETLHIDPSLERKQIERVQALRARRDSAAVEQRLAALKATAAGEGNLMPVIIDAARDYISASPPTQLRRWPYRRPFTCAST